MFWLKELDHQNHVSAQSISTSNTLTLNSLVNKYKISLMMRKRSTWIIRIM